MVDERILKYAKENFKKGFTLEEIRKGLIEQKLPLKTIDECISIVAQFQGDLKIRKRIWPFRKKKKHKEEEIKGAKKEKPLKEPKEIKVSKKEKPKKRSGFFSFLNKNVNKVRPKKGKSSKPVEIKKEKPQTLKKERPLITSLQDKPRSRFAPVSKKKKKFPYGLKVFFAVVFVIGFIILFLFLLTKYSPPPKKYVTISEFKVAEGVSFNVFQGSEINFTFEDEKYYIFIKEINSEKGYVKISGSLNETLWEGKQRSFNLDKDMAADLIFQLEEIGEKDVATLYLKEYGDFVCPENWECTEWGPCLEGFQKRICVDSNDCGTFKLKPSLEKTCIPGTKTYYDDGSGGSGYFINCGTENFNLVNTCLIESSVNCSKSNLMGSSGVEISGYILSLTKYFEIKGFDNESKCLFYQKDIAHSLDYSDELIQDLLDQGKTMEEIQEMKEQDNESVQNSVGLWSECKFDTEDLTAVLIEWNFGNYSSGVDCEIVNNVPVNCSFDGFFEGLECGVAFSP